MTKAYYPKEHKVYSYSVIQLLSFGDLTEPKHWAVPHDVLAARNRIAGGAPGKSVVQGQKSIVHPEGPYILPLWN